MTAPHSNKKTPEKLPASEASTRRAPQQARALHKVGLILEAAIRLIDEGGIESVTTNALAKTAGISVGTLYQYFPDKGAVITALIEREVATLSDRLLKGFTSEPPGAPGDRVRLVVRIVLDAYGSRKRAHRVLLLHAMSRGTATRLDETIGRLAERLTSGGLGTAQGLSRSVSASEAFVLTHAISGVLRAMLASHESPPRDAVEDALVRMVIGFWPQVGRA